MKRCHCFVLVHTSHRRKVKSNDAATALYPIFQRSLSTTRVSLHQPSDLLANFDGLCYLEAADSDSIPEGHRSTRVVEQLTHKQRP